MPLTLMMKSWKDLTWRYVIRKILLVFHDRQILQHTVQGVKSRNGIFEGQDGQPTAL